MDLTTLLDEAEVDRTATYLWPYGADYGEFEGTHCDWYLKDLPLERLAAGDRRYSVTDRRPERIHTVAATVAS